MKLEVSYYWCRKRSWLWHVPRRDGLVLEGKIIGKPARGRRRLNVVSDFAEKRKYVTLKSRVKDGREVAESWRELEVIYLLLSRLLGSSSNAVAGLLLMLDGCNNDICRSLKCVCVNCTLCDQVIMWVCTAIGQMLQIIKFFVFLIFA